MKAVPQGISSFYLEHFDFISIVISVYTMENCCLFVKIGGGGRGGGSYIISISSAERFNFWPDPDVISNECFCLRWNFHRGLVLHSWLKIESIHLYTSRDLIIKEFPRQVTNN